MSIIRKSMRGSCGVALALGLTVLSGAALQAATPMEAGASTTNKLTFGGDLRVRHESFFNAGADDRHRERFRLRFGVKAEMDKWDAALRLASGTGEQVSTNQTFGNSWNQKNLYIDQAYGTYKPMDWVKISGGKMENPFWRIYSSDLVWDGDLNPEGFAQQMSYDVHESINLFGNFLEAPVNEISNSKRDPWLYGQQMGVKTKPMEGVRWSLAVANYAVSHEKISPLHSTGTVDSTVIQEANTRVPGSALLAGQYQMIHLTSELGFQAGIPVAIQGDFVRNVHHERTNNQATGYQFGVILGKAKTAGSCELGLFKKYSEANATLSDFADSDWGNGGTNRKGYVLWYAHAFTDFFTMQAKYFITTRTNPYINTSAPYLASTTHRPADLNRLQIDAILKF